MVQGIEMQLQCCPKINGQTQHSGEKFDFHAYIKGPEFRPQSQTA